MAKNKQKTKVDPKIREMIAAIAKFERPDAKKGKRLKVKGDKTKTKMIKGRCLHYTISKKDGHIKGTINVRPGKDGKDELFCTLCGASWKPTLPDNEELTKVVEKMTEVNNRFKYLATTLGFRDGARLTSDVGGSLGLYKQMGKSIIKYVEKQREKKNAGRGKKKNRGNGGGNGGYAPSAGQWYGSGN